VVPTEDIVDENDDGVTANEDMFDDTEEARELDFEGWVDFEPELPPQADNVKIKLNITKNLKFRFI
jgi:hypothetical protein